VPFSSDDFAFLSARIFFAGAEFSPRQNVFHQCPAEERRAPDAAFALEATFLSAGAESRLPWGSTGVPF
jgi:hypothetical protein